MKKYLSAILVCLLSVNMVCAKDYAKLQIKEMKHAQKYGTTQKYLNNNIVAPQTEIAVSNRGLKDPKLIKLGNYEKIDEQSYNQKLENVRSCSWGWRAVWQGVSWIRIIA